MKTLADIDQIMEAFENRHGLLVRGAEQLSEAWFQMRLGVITASNVSKAVAKKDSATRHTYMCELISEVCTGVVEEISFKQTEWGKENEKGARSSYEFATNQTITPVSFIYKDTNFREGCSPDGLILDLNRGTEIKCPWDSANYIKFLLEEEIKPEWRWQTQFCMRVTGAESWDMTMYDPRMKTQPLHTKTFERNEKMQTQFDETIPEFIQDMDLLLKKLGVEFGSHWARLAEKRKEQA